MSLLILYSFELDMLADWQQMCLCKYWRFYCFKSGRMLLDGLLVFD